MPKAKLTGAFVRKSACPNGKERTEFFDTDLKGFVLEVRTGGGKTFYVRYRDPRGTQCQIKIGPAAVLTVEEARSKAKTLLSQVALGGNPLAEREILRSIPTLADFVRDLYLPHIKGYKRSWFVDDTKLRLHIIPQFGKLPSTRSTRKSSLPSARCSVPRACAPPPTTEF
jgi:Arm DNA-binding domain